MRPTDGQTDKWPITNMRTPLHGGACRGRPKGLWASFREHVSIDCMNIN